MWTKHLPRPDQCVFVAFDTETTSLQPAAGRLVEVAAVRFTHTGAVMHEFVTLVDPGEPIPVDARLIHGITDEMVAGAPSPAEAVARLLAEFEGENVIGVAHNAPFDMAFLMMALARSGGRPPEVPVIDTRLLARQVIPGMTSYALDQLASYFRIPNPEHHRALPDARTAMAVFLQLLDYITAEQFQELPRQMDIFTFADADIAPAQAPEGFEELAVALEEGRDVLIRYAGGTKGVGERRLTPLALYRQGSRIYLAAFCHRDRKEKNFRLDRIISLRLAE